MSCRELPVDILEFFCLTPLPGSEDHKNLYEQGVKMDPDLNKYNLEHVTTEHPVMTRAQWYEVYENAWHQYYTPEHIETMMRRVDAKNMSAGFLKFLIVLFYGGIIINKLHPLESGTSGEKCEPSDVRFFLSRTRSCFIPGGCGKFFITISLW